MIISVEVIRRYLYMSLHIARVMKLTEFKAMTIFECKMIILLDIQSIPDLVSKLSLAARSRLSTLSCLQRLIRQLSALDVLEAVHTWTQVRLAQCV